MRLNEKTAIITGSDGIACSIEKLFRLGQRLSVNLVPARKDKSRRQ